MATCFRRILFAIVFFAATLVGHLSFQAADPAFNVLAAAPPDRKGEQTVAADDSGGGASARSPVPSDEKLKEALKDVQEVYAAELSAAKTAEAKKALAKKLLMTARDTDKAKGTSARYVLLRMARDYAMQVGDAETAFEAVEEIAGSFEVDSLETRSAALGKLVPTARTKDQHKALAAKGLILFRTAIADDEIAVARQLIGISRAEAQKANDKALVDKIAELASEIDGIAKSYEVAKPAFAVLKKTPSDPHANLAVGKYEALFKGNWTTGLPMLAVGTDVALKDVAAKDLAGAEAADARVVIGDQWWDLAEKLDGIAKRRLRARAAYWYNQALAELSGLSKQKIERRVKQVSAELARAGESIDKPDAAEAHSKTKKTDLVGPPTGKEFDDLPGKRSLLVGFDIALGTWAEKPVPFVWSLQPIYANEKGTFMGSVYGHPGIDKIRHVVAKPGYAVAGMTVNAENLVAGIKLKFMRIRGMKLDPKDSYESDWIGGQWGKQEVTVGGDGKPVIGCFGRSGDGVDCLGLILSE